MKATKRIIISLVVLALLVTAVLGMVACQKQEPIKDTEVIITIDTNVMADIEGKTLADYMAAMKDKGILSYEGKEGQYGWFIETINGRTADEKTEYWALYTDDEENSSTDWGSYVADGKTCGFASLGASSMPIKAGKIYVWVLTPLA